MKALRHFVILAASCVSWTLAPLAEAQEAAAPPAPAPPAAATSSNAVSGPAATQPAANNPQPRPVTVAEVEKPAGTASAKPALIPLETLMDPEVIKTLSEIPVQQVGRVKPLDSVARFTLLPMHGKQSIKAEKFDEASGKVVPVTDPLTGKPVVNARGKSKLSAMEWLMISLFRPDIGRTLNVFVVDNSDAVAILGLHGKGKRDRYSFAEIEQGREKLMQKMRSYEGANPKNLSPEDRAILKLSQDFLDYEAMLTHFDFVRAPFGDQAGSVPVEILPEAERAQPRMAAVLPRMAAHFKEHPQVATPTNPWFLNFFRSVLSAKMNGIPAEQLNIFPPEKKDQEEWRNPGVLMHEAFAGLEISKGEYAMLTAYEELGRAAIAGDSGLFKTRAKELSAMLAKAAADRGESGHIGLELHLHRTAYFTNALVFFIIGSLALGLSWVSPGTLWERVCSVICWISMGTGALLGTVGIVIRCLIMERPPVATLYETIIFITTTSVIGALLVEWLSRRKGLAMMVGCIAGVAGMFLSIRFFEMEGRDSLQQLQAVLITNFWLATHVPCINLGYAAGMVASIASVVYITRRLFGITKAGDADARTLTRISYAFVLVGLFLSLVGTVLGGVWANYSWGRFWGWDPKENGALMIVLANLIILHARLGGYIREAGLHVTCVILGIITIFSWFATNQLGIGLHAYGELSGAWMWLYIIWGMLTLVALAGIGLARFDRRPPDSGGITGASSREDQMPGNVLHPQAAAKS